MRAISRMLIAGAAAAFLTLASAVSAVAHGEDEVPARDLVLQAIALIVNQPDDVHEIEEHVERALDAEEHEGVDVELVEEAAAALEDGELAEARESLQTAIGAGPAAGIGVPEEIGESSGEPGQPVFAAGAETGTTVVLDEYEPDSAVGGGEVALLALSAAAILGGVALAWWLRPSVTMRQLRRSATAPGETR
ncbi:MAG TPA: hypothetical protein VFZ37_19900 [Jiangellaceae bacterium]